MPQISLAEVLSELQPIEMHGSEAAGALILRHVTADSREVMPGSLFVAIDGAQVDGHRFVQSAIAGGASAIVGTLSYSALAELGQDVPAHIPYVRVANARRALAVASAASLGYPSRSLAVVGVTGTDGKTTTATLLESILAAATRLPDDAAGKVGVITTVGARIRGEEIDTGFHVTTPDAPAVQEFLAHMRSAGCLYAVVESTSHGLDQGRVDAVDFDVAVVTNITHEHLDYHGTRDAYVSAKALLFRKLFASPAKPDVARCAVLNGDDSGSYDTLCAVMEEEQRQYGQTIPVRAYGIAEDTNGRRQNQRGVDVYADLIDYAPDRTRFRLTWWQGTMAIETALIGQFNVYNVLAAATAALALGIAPDDVRTGIAAMSGVSGRMERIDRGQPFLAVVDFAHSPASLERALQTLRPLAELRADGATRSGRLIAVFGSAGLRDRAKRRLMGAISGRLADFTVITAEDPRTEDLASINREIAAGVAETADTERYAIVPDRTAAIEFAVRMARPGDVVAAFGKGHERSMCFGVVEQPWSDQQAMADALDKWPVFSGNTASPTRENGTE